MAAPGRPLVCTHAGGTRPATAMLTCIDRSTSALCYRRTSLLSWPEPDDFSDPRARPAVRDVERQSTLPVVFTLALVLVLVVGILVVTTMARGRRDHDRRGQVSPPLATVVRFPSRVTRKRAPGPVSPAPVACCNTYRLSSGPKVKSMIAVNPSSKSAGHSPGQCDTRGRRLRRRGPPSARLRNTRRLGPAPRRWARHPSLFGDARGSR